MATDASASAATTDLQDLARRHLWLHFSRMGAYDRGAEMPVIVRGEGCYVWDADGNRYLDLMCAYGPNLLGYHDPRVDAAARAQMARGDALTGPSPVMVELAETLVGMVSHAQWALRDALGPAVAWGAGAAAISRGENASGSNFMTDFKDGPFYSKANWAAQRRRSRAGGRTPRSA